MHKLLKSKVLFYTLFLFIGILIGCNQTNCDLKTIQTIVLIDTVFQGDYFKVEIPIPDFDSTIDYKCITGKFDTISDGKICKLEMNKSRDYTQWNKPRLFNTTKSFILLLNSEEPGINHYQGILTFNCNNDLNKTYSFYGDYYVIQDTNISKNSIEPILSDTLEIPDSCIIFINPTSAELEAAKNEMGEDNYYTACDDIMYYQHLIYNRLDSVGYHHLDIKSKNFIIQNRDQFHLINIDTLENLFPIIKYSSINGPEVVDIWYMMDYLRIE